MKTSRVPVDRRGFTLIETLVYLALYAIIMTGAITAVYSIFESSARNETIAMIEEEGDFLQGKFEWNIANASSIELPESSGSMLTLTLHDGSHVVLSSSGTNIQIAVDGGEAEILNNTNVSIPDLAFVHTLPSSDGIDPESIRASCTMQATTSDGHALSRDFSTLKYLRK